MKFFVSLFFISTFHQTFSQYPDSIKLNDIRILASHNSYKKKPSDKVIKYLNKFNDRLGEENNPERINYGHLKIEDQFNQFNIRGLELDVYYDPKGKRYAKRKLNLFVKGEKQNPKIPALKKAGFKLLHIADIDYETNYLTLIEALVEINQWSNEHPNHTPLFINIEPKTKNPGDYSKLLYFLGFKKVLQFDSIAWNCLENEIISIIPKNKIYTPSELKSNYECFYERITNVGWPSLNETLGKIFFIIDGDNNGDYQKFVNNPLMFHYDISPNENTAFLKRNNPFEKTEEINQLSEFYIIRTRSDVETIEAKNNDYSMFNAALKSNAQIISTDFYAPDNSFGTFQIKLPKAQNELQFVDFILRK